MGEPKAVDPVVALPVSHAGHSAAWMPALATLASVLAMILLLYRDTAIGMVTIWYRSETFAHAFVVPPIVLWLVWRKRQEIAELPPSPALWILFPMAFVALLWLLGDMVAVNSVTQLALTALLVLAVPAVLGVQVARVIAFPLGFLFFSVPIGEFLLPQLMEGTANFTILALRLSGIPVYREGLQFVIPSGNWSVVEACSGVRYLIASLTVGTLFAYLNYQSTKRRAIFLLVSILVPIVANWMRAYMIVMLGHLSGNTLAVGVDHLVYGWAFFGIVIILMFIIGAKWSEPEKAVILRETSSSAQLTAVPALRYWLVAACMALVLALPVAALQTMERSAPTGNPVLASPALLERGWKKSELAIVDFKPAFDDPSAETNAIYDDAGKPIGLYLGYYEGQNYKRKLVSSNNVLVASEDLDWSRVSGGTIWTKVGGEAVAMRTSELRRLRIARPDAAERLTVWQIYWIDGTLTANDYLAKVYSALHRLTGRGDKSAVIIVYAAKNQGGEDAALEAFLSTNYGAIDALLRQAGKSR